MVPLGIGPSPDGPDGDWAHLRIQPASSALDPARVTAALDQLYGLDTTIEVRLTATADEPLAYFVGTRTPHRDRLERVCRALFPSTYELTPGTPPQPPPDSTAIEFHGRGERAGDWQTGLRPAVTDDGITRLPLTGLAETMAGLDGTTVYQALCRPKPDWTADADRRHRQLETRQDTPTQRWLGDPITVASEPDADRQRLDPAHRERLESIAATSTRRSFTVAARLLTTDPAGREALASVFSAVDGAFYRVEPRHRTGSDARSAHQNLLDRRVEPTQPLRARIARRLPGTANRAPTIVVDAATAPAFLLLAGDRLSPAAHRRLAPTPGEKTAIRRPPNAQLDRYRDRGMRLGQPLTGDGTPAESIHLPPALQPLHVAWFGKTGAGKSTALVNAILANHTATDGADILVDPKGDGMAEAYLRAHYAVHGTLENVRYFDCAEVLPAFSFFDIRDELAAGVPRTTAVEDAADHYLEVLTQIMGRERFEQAVRSPDVIRYLVKALFDPVNGQDGFAHRDLHGALRRMHERQSVPAVADPELERMLGGLVANRARTFDEIMQGVANRIEKIPADRRLARLFNHVPDEEDPHFDLVDYLDADTVVIFDTGGLRAEAQRVFTLVLLSNLWTALRRRRQRNDGPQPLVNLYIEEAASIAVSDLLKELLAQARGFDCAITLAMQFPAQLRDQDRAVYDELLNNVSTFLTGNVPIDRRLAERLATADMAPQDVGNRLRALDRGQWLCTLPAPFSEPEPRPFLLRSAPPPPGDPAGEEPLEGESARAFAADLDTLREATLETAGLELTSPSPAVQGPARDGPVEESPRPVDTALPHTNRLPPTVEYDAGARALRCTECDNRYDPRLTGMRRAINCCSTLAAVNRDDVPICALNLKLSPEERAATDWTDGQLMFLQAVYNAQQGRYDPLEYDVLQDSMLRLQEYVDVDSEAVQDLLDSDLLNHDTDHPHRLVSVTPAGRSTIGESYRQGVDYGHGKGDLEESTQHVFGVQIGIDLLELRYQDDPDSPVVEVVPYYDLTEAPTVTPPADDPAADAGRDAYNRRRLDIVGLDSAGRIRVTVEVERINNDSQTAIPEDYDKMAACDPDAAIWIVMTQPAGHEVLRTLNDPLDGETRVEKSYAESTPPQQFRIDTTGLTAIYPATWLRDTLAAGAELP